MKSVLKLLLAGVLTCVMAGVAMGQAEGQSPKADKVSEKIKVRSADQKMMPEPQVQLKRLTKGLELTEAQQDQIRPVLEDEYAKLKEIRKNEDISPKEIQKRIEKLRSGTIAKVLTFLTPEQQEKYRLVSNEIKSNKQKRMKENRKERLGTKPEQPEHSSH